MIEFQVRYPEEPTCESARLQAATAPACAQIVSCFGRLLESTATIWHILPGSPTLVELRSLAQHDGDARVFHVERWG